MLRSRLSHACVLSVVSVALSAAMAPALAGRPLSLAAAPLAGSEGSVPTDRIIVRYKADVSDALPSEAALQAARVAGNKQGVSLSHHRRTALGAHVLKLDRALGSEQIAALIRDLKSGDSNVDYAEPDRILTAQFTPTDPLYAQQWHYFEATAGINLPPAWDKSTGSGVVVAVIDTGVRPHADLAANLLPGYDFITSTMVSNDGNGRDADAADPGDAVAAGFCGTGSPAENSGWHGTHVSGTVAALTQNGAGVAGVAHGAKVLPIRVLGRCGGYTSDIADGMVWASGGAVSGVPANPNPARVLNLSLGGGGACDTTTQNAINSARSRGAVVVVAAGNANADSSQFSPASCNGVISVAAVGRTGGKASYSNFGSLVSIAAPGGDGSNGVLSTLNAGTSTPGADSYAAYLGTSMATPHVSGVVALMLSKNPALTPDQVLAMLRASARPFPAACSQCGAGLLDANAAVNAALGTATNPPPTSTPSLAEAEPNNSTSKAQAVASWPVTVAGTLSATTDTDYFKVTVPAGATLKAALTPNANANYDLLAYNGGGRLLASSTLGTGQTDTLSLGNGGTTSTVVYLRVTFVSGTVGSAGTYQLLLSR